MTMTNPFVEQGKKPSEAEFLFILVPGAIEPYERERRFGDPLDAELRIAGIGYVSGGGSLLSDLDDHGRRKIIYAGVDVETIDVEAARTLLRDHLPELQCPAGTRIQYADWQDYFDGADWQLEQPRHDEV